MTDLTIIIPAYNEEVGIRETVLSLLDSVKEQKWQILVINDGSTDRTKEILKEFSTIRIIDHPYNKGYGASLKTGIKNSITELIAFYDADGQHSPQDLKNLVNNMSCYDIIIGQRDRESYQDWIRKPGKYILKIFANFLTGQKIPDLNSGLRIVRRDVIMKMLHLFPEGFSFSTTSTIAFMNTGYNVGYFPITTRKRKGNSTVKQLKHGSGVVLLILRLIVLFYPLKVFLPVSFTFFLIGIIYEIIYGIILMQEGMKLIPGAFFMIITGILLFFFGLLVDQVSEMRKHQFDNR